MIWFLVGYFCGLAGQLIFALRKGKNTFIQYGGDFAKQEQNVTIKKE